MTHPFTDIILGILRDHFGKDADQVYERSLLIQYLNVKTRSANRGSKARSAFANHYALYVLIEDYIKNGFAESSGSYANYDGAKFSDLLTRQRQLPFGQKLQNHALNNRLNEEFKAYFPTADLPPILRDTKTKRYWINENLLNIVIGRNTRINLAKAILQIIDAYIDMKKGAFESFIQTTEQLNRLALDDHQQIVDFVTSQLQSNVDARIFEIVSFAILKTYYSGQRIFWGWSLDAVSEDILVLYKTGRTNANDGGIDFVMKPLGRFFQVTETTSVNKYFLDIDKLQHYPLTFVVKSNHAVDKIRQEIRSQAERKYSVLAIIERYMQSIEEIINTEELLRRFYQIMQDNKIKEVIDEIILQSKVEFNFD